jgi:hypothetical protein
MAKHALETSPSPVRQLLAGLAAGAVAVGAALLGAGTASADPIVCPSGQESVKTATGWDCQNNGGNLSNAEDPRNPNASKGDF